MALALTLVAPCKRGRPDKPDLPRLVLDNLVTFRSRWNRPPRKKAGRFCGPGRRMVQNETGRPSKPARLVLDNLHVRAAWNFAGPLASFWNP